MENGMSIYDVIQLKLVLLNDAVKFDGFFNKVLSTTEANVTISRDDVINLKNEIDKLTETFGMYLDESSKRLKLTDEDWR